MRHTTGFEDTCAWPVAHAAMVVVAELLPASWWTLTAIVNGRRKPLVKEPQRLTRRLARCYAYIV